MLGSSQATFWGTFTVRLDYLLNLQSPFPCRDGSTASTAQPSEYLSFRQGFSSQLHSI